MGQQQLLLLVLGIVLVGLAVVVGIDAFNENQRKSRIDLTQHMMMDVVAKAQAWKLTPAAMGGGEGGAGDRDFTGFQLANIGLSGSRVDPTDPSNTDEIILRTDYACLRITSNERKIEVRAVDTGCQTGSWFMRYTARGTTLEDIEWELHPDPRRMAGSGW